MVQRLFEGFLILIAAGCATAQAIPPVNSLRLVFATYLGTGPNSVERGLATDSAGYSFIGGSGPGTGTSPCAFLTKLNKTGTAAVWSVCLPLAEVDGVAVDSADNVYIVGGDATTGVHNSTVIKLSSDAQTTLYSTAIVGAYTASIALDGRGDAYIAGSAESTFQATSGAYLSKGGGAFAIIALSADGSGILVSENFNSFVQNVALDGSGGLYVAGNTLRQEFLTTPGAYQVLYPGGQNSGYVSRFDLTTPALAAQFSVIVNAASFMGAMTPGEIVTLFGVNLPSNPQVTFDGHPAPILYSDAKQINAVVPFEVSAANQWFLWKAWAGTCFQFRLQYLDCSQPMPPDRDSWRR